MRRPLRLWSMLAAVLLLGVAVLAEKRDFRLLTDVEVEAIVKLDPPEWSAVDAGHMEHLLVPRVSGTENNTKVQEYLSGVMTGLGWAEEKVAHKENTPLGEREFTNLVYTFDPDAPRRLVLSAHFDSKWFNGQPFIGATDSAAPCAYLLDIAEALTPLMQARAERIKAGHPRLSATVDELEDSEVSLQLVFFDGEEAFERWTAADSVYGSRHLAEVWDVTPLSAAHPLQRRRGTPSVLDTIDVLVLLDLLGARGPRLTSHYQNTEWLFAELEGIDGALRAARLVDGADQWFHTHGRSAGHIDDDHRPFLQRGVPILHLIPVPFPPVWHKMADDKDALDLATCRRWISIMRVWTARYLGLAPDAAPKETQHPDADANANANAKPAPTAAAAEPAQETQDARRDELVRTTST